MKYEYAIDNPLLYAGDRMTQDEIRSRAEAFAAELQRLWSAATTEREYNWVSHLASVSRWPGGFLYRVRVEDCPAVEIVKAAEKWREQQLWDRIDGNVAEMRRWNQGWL